MVLRGCVWVGESFWNHDKWHVKLLSEFFPIHIQHFMSDSNSKNNNLQGFENSWMDMRGCVWVGESFWNHDKWEIILLSEFFPNSHSTFYEWLTQKIITHRVLKIHEWLWGDVCEQGKVSQAMTSDR